MSNKYIIRNCPAFDDGDCASPTEHIPYATACEHIEDCKIKQIIELCGKYHVIDAGYQKVAINYLSSDILKLLDIQEVE